jgi:hypothetical protein
MKTVSLKINDSIFGETERILKQEKRSRNKYINDAIAFYNRFQRRLFLEKKLKTESEMVGEESLNVLTEFESLEYEDQTI